MDEVINVNLILNWYEIEGNNLVDEELIQNMSVDDILKLFDAPFWNKLYHCWSADADQLNTIQKNVQHNIDTSKYAYFVEIVKVL